MIARSGSFRPWSCRVSVVLPVPERPKRRKPTSRSSWSGPRTRRIFDPAWSPSPPAALDPVHRLPEHRLLGLAGVVGAEDVRVALVDVEEDQRLRPVRQVDRDEVRLLRGVGREEHVVPHVRDPRILLRHVEAAVDRRLGAHSHAPVDLDQVHLRKRFLDLADLLGRFGAFDRLLHHADFHPVGHDVGLLGRPVLDPRRVDGGAVLGRLLARTCQRAELLARQILGDRSGPDGPWRDGLDGAHECKSFCGKGFEFAGNRYL